MTVVHPQPPPETPTAHSAKGLFLTELVLIPMAGRRWRLHQDFIYWSLKMGEITVPKGFVTDLNSVPRFIWWVSTPADFPRTGVLHDYAYHIQMPRAQADALYREVLHAEGAHRFRRVTRWATLRMFGWIAYRKHRKEETPDA